MRRKKPSEQVERFRRRTAPELADLARRCTRWAQDNADALAAADPEIPEDLNDRASDNWEPLLAIADLAGGDWPEAARKAALALSGGEAEADSLRTRFLADLRGLYEERRTDRLSSTEIVDALGSMEEAPWPEWYRGKPITPRQVAVMLRPFGVIPKTLRMGDDRAKGYYLADLQDAFSRYLPPAIRSAVTTQENRAFSGNFIRDGEGLVTDAESAKSPASIGLSRCHGLEGGEAPIIMGEVDGRFSPFPEDRLPPGLRRGGE